jgi:hypothetical protein
MVCVTCNPQPVENDSKFSRHGNDCPLLAVFPASLEHSRAPAFEVTIWTKASQ